MHPYYLIMLIEMIESSHLICFCHNLFNRAKETNMYEIKLWRVRSQIPYADTELFYFPVLFSKILRFR